VIDTVVGRIGVLICYDAQFPEVARLLGLRGAEMIAVPTNWAPAAPPAGERYAEMIAAMAAARANRVFMVCCDRAGRERGVEFSGASAIIGPDGWILAAADERGLAVADVQIGQARMKTRGEYNDVMADRRPELYDGIAAIAAERTG
jgi:5-aminopentanamidase